MARDNWTREQLILAFNLYCRLPFGRLHHRNPQIIELAGMIGRTPSAVALKLSNFARLDPSLQQRGIKGASHGSKADEVIWDEFNNNWDKLAVESEALYAKLLGKQVPEPDVYDDSFELAQGKEALRLSKVRVNQGFFRTAVLSAYNNQCAITGIANIELLNASHIIPWRVDSTNRLNPRNGICLNALHDRAFDRGLITIDDDYRVVVSDTILNNDSRYTEEYFSKYHLKEITLPEKFLPDKGFLEYHRGEVFVT